MVSVFSACAVPVPQPMQPCRPHRLFPAQPLIFRAPEFHRAIPTGATDFSGAQLRKTRAAQGNRRPAASPSGCCGNTWFMTTRDELPGLAESYWMATTPGTRWPTLDADTTADVVVIGAGMAGLSTAWELTRAGRNVVVLEADRVAAGVSGYTTAKLTAAHSLVYERLRRTRGKEGARQYAHSQQAAVERVASVATELGVDCDLERSSALTFTIDPKRRATFEAEAEAPAVPRARSCARRTPGAIPPAQVPPGAGR